MPRNNVLSPDGSSGTVANVALKRFTVKLDKRLIAAVREAAEAEGLTLSDFMADAADARVRNWKLRVLIGELDPFDEDEADRILAESKRRFFWTSGGR